MRNNSFPEIAVRWVPGAIERTQETKEPSRRQYDALIYASLPQPFNLPSAGSGAPHPDELAGLPLRGVEHMEFVWPLTNEFAERVVSGEKSIVLMKRRLTAFLPHSLLQLFSASGQGPSQNGPTRLWWSSAAPELEDLPWELLAQDQQLGFDGARRVLVRGVPPQDQMPRVPVGAHLRVALIGLGGERGTQLRNTLHKLSSSGLRVSSYREPTRLALRRAVREGCEVIHWMTGGHLSLAHDSLLSPPLTEISIGENLPAEEPITAAELSEILRYSRVGVVALSPFLPFTEPTATIGRETQIGREAQNVFRAFAHLGASRHPLPNVVLPLGMMPATAETSFWREFYKALQRTLDVEAAVSTASSANYSPRETPQPFALYLRQRQRGTFRRSAHTANASDVAWTSNPSDHEPKVGNAGGISDSPSRLNANLEESRDVLTRIEALSATVSDLPASVLEFLEQERQRHDAISEELRTWRESE